MERIPQRHLFESFEQLLVQDRWTFRVALYAPWLFHWWMNQKLFPSLSMMAGTMDIFSEPDLEFLKKLPPNPDGNQGYEDKIIPYKVNRFLSEKLPFVRYHEIPAVAQCFQSVGLRHRRHFNDSANDAMLRGITDAILIQIPVSAQARFKDEYYKFGFIMLNINYGCKGGEECRTGSLSTQDTVPLDFFQGNVLLVIEGKHLRFELIDEEPGIVDADKVILLGDEPETTLKKHG
ncbi:hypothetical protein Tco_0607697 [Tanacetum coccineum]